MSVSERELLEPGVIDQRLQSVACEGFSHLFVYLSSSRALWLFWELLLRGVKSLHLAGHPPATT